MSIRYGISYVSCWWQIRSVRKNQTACYAPDPGSCFVLAYRDADGWLMLDTAMSEELCLRDLKELRNLDLLHLKGIRSLQVPELLKTVPELVISDLGPEKASLLRHPLDSAIRFRISRELIQLHQKSWLDAIHDIVRTEEDYVFLSRSWDESKYAKNQVGQLAGLTFQCLQGISAEGLTSKIITQILGSLFRCLKQTCTELSLDIPVDSIEERALSEKISESACTIVELWLERARITRMTLKNSGLVSDRITKSDAREKEIQLKKKPDSKWKEPERYVYKNGDLDMSELRNIVSSCARFRKPGSVTAKNHILLGRNENFFIIRNLIENFFENKITLEGF